MKEAGLENGVKQSRGSTTGAAPWSSGQPLCGKAGSMLPDWTFQEKFKIQIFFFNVATSDF